MRRPLLLRHVDGSVSSPLTSPQDPAARLAALRLCNAERALPAPILISRTYRVRTREALGEDDALLELRHIHTSGGQRRQSAPRPRAAAIPASYEQVHANPPLPPKAPALVRAITAHRISPV
ncbi:MAG: hypothetical protein V3V08_06960 [Nannocystaceae bacterium]